MLIIYIGISFVYRSHKKDLPPDSKKSVGKSLKKTDYLFFIDDFSVYKRIQNFEIGVQNGEIGAFADFYRSSFV